MGMNDDSVLTLQENALKQSEDANRQLESTNSKLKEELAMLKESNCKLNENYESLHASKMKLEEDVTNLSSQLKSCAQRLGEKDEDLIRKESSLLEAMKHYDQTRSELMEMSKQNGELELAKLALQTSVDLKQREVEDCEKRLEYVKKSNQELEAQVTELNNLHRKLKTSTSERLSTLTYTVEDLQKEKTVSETRIQTLNNENKELRDNLTKSQTEQRNRKFKDDEAIQKSEDQLAGEKHLNSIYEQKLKSKEKELKENSASRESQRIAYEESITSLKENVRNAKLDAEN